jgi:hypothetical protein
MALTLTALEGLHGPLLLLLLLPETELLLTVVTFTLTSVMQTDPLCPQDFTWMV